MPDTVKIGCRVPEGLRLRVYEFQDGPDGTTAIELGMIELAGASDGDVAYTDVDTSLWEPWFAFNKDTDLVTGRSVYKGNATPKAPPRAPEKPADGADASASKSDAPPPPKAP